MNQIELISEEVDDSNLTRGNFIGFQLTELKDDLDTDTAMHAVVLDQEDKGIIQAQVINYMTEDNTVELSFDDMFCLTLKKNGYFDVKGFDKDISIPVYQIEDVQKRGASDFFMNEVVKKKGNKACFLMTTVNRNFDTNEEN